MVHSDFTGQYEHSIDTKNRVNIPSAYRKILAEMNASEVVISKGIDSRHIDVYHPEKWDALIKSLKSKASNNFNPRYRRLIREFAGNASRCKIDSQGRIMLTPHLMEMAGIRQGAKVSIVGIIDIIEIWDLDVYLQDLKDNPLTLDDLESVGQI